MVGDRTSSSSRPRVQEVRALARGGGVFRDTDGSLFTVPGDDDNSLDFDMHALADAVIAKGFHAHVEQTGGGVATLFAGERHVEDERYGQRYQVSAGPGWFEGQGWTQPRASTLDFNIGPDSDECDNQDITRVGAGATVEQIANMIVAHIGSAR